MENTVKKAFYKKWWFWAIIVVVFIAIGSSAKPQTSSSTPANSQAPESQKAIPVSPKEETIKVTASELYEAYNANQIAADEKYKGKILEITGIVDSIGKDILDDPYVKFDASNPFMGVQCMLDKSEVSKASALKKGQKVTLSGRGDGALIGAIVRGCVIVE